MVLGRACMLGARTRHLRIIYQKQARFGYVDHLLRHTTSFLRPVNDLLESDLPKADQRYKDDILTPTTCHVAMMIVAKNGAVTTATAVIPQFGKLEGWAISSMPIR